MLGGGGNLGRPILHLQLILKGSESLVTEVAREDLARLLSMDLLYEICLTMQMELLGSFHTDCGE
jgi:hypothetical protein